MRATLVLVCLLVATGCAANRPTGPEGRLDRELTLARGERPAIGGTPLSLLFVRVSGDSRCPADAVCVLGGDATVHLRLSSGNADTDLELHTGDAERASAAVGRFRVTLTDLQPYPFSSRPIDPDDYRATVRVTEQES